MVTIISPVPAPVGYIRAVSCTFLFFFFVFFKQWVRPYTVNGLPSTYVHVYATSFGASRSSWLYLWRVTHLHLLLDIGRHCRHHTPVVRIRSVVDLERVMSILIWRQSKRRLPTPHYKNTGWTRQLYSSYYTSIRSNSSENQPVWYLNKYNAQTVSTIHTYIHTKSVNKVFKRFLRLLFFRYPLLSVCIY